MKVCDIPIHKLAIGQVVYIPGSGVYGFVCAINAETQKSKRAWNGDYESPRYTSIALSNNTGNNSGFHFHAQSGSQIAVNRVLEEKEFFSFAEIVERESENWKPLEG